LNQKKPLRASITNKESNPKVIQNPILFFLSKNIYPKSIASKGIKYTPSNSPTAKSGFQYGFWILLLMTIGYL